MSASLPKRAQASEIFKNSKDQKKREKHIAQVKPDRSWLGSVKTTKRTHTHEPNPKETMTSTIDSVCQQLESQGVNDYACFGSSGLPPIRASGCFSDDEGQTAARALALLQQSAALLKGGERLKRVTATFGDHTFVATSVISPEDGQQSFGLVVRR